LSDESLLFYELNSFSVSWIEIFLRKFLEQSFSHCFPIKNVKYSAKNESQQKGFQSTPKLWSLLIKE